MPTRKAQDRFARLSVCALCRVWPTRTTTLEVATDSSSPKVTTLQTWHFSKRPRLSPPASQRPRLELTDTRKGFFTAADKAKRYFFSTKNMFDFRRFLKKFPSDGSSLNGYILQGRAHYNSDLNSLVSLAPRGRFSKKIRFVRAR